MNTKNENNIINDEKLDAVTGGTITVNDFSAEMTVGGPLNPAIDKKDIPTDEETWLGQ